MGSRLVAVTEDVAASAEASLACVELVGETIEEAPEEANALEEAVAVAAAAEEDVSVVVAVLVAGALSASPQALVAEAITNAIATMMPRPRPRRVGSARMAVLIS